MEEELTDKQSQNEDSDTVEDTTWLEDEDTEDLTSGTFKGSLDYVNQGGKGSEDESND